MAGDLGRDRAFDLSGNGARSQPCHLQPVERSQRSLTQQLRDAETTVCFRRGRGNGESRREVKRRLRDATRCSKWLPELAIKLRKGRHPKMAAFSCHPTVREFRDRPECFCSLTARQSSGGRTRRDSDSQLENAQSAPTRRTFRRSSQSDQVLGDDSDSPALSRLVELWPDLPEDVRLQILALAEAAGDSSAR